MSALDDYSFLLVSKDLIIPLLISAMQPHCFFVAHRSLIDLYFFVVARSGGLILCRWWVQLLFLLVNLSKHFEILGFPGLSFFENRICSQAPVSEVCLILERLPSSRICLSRRLNFLSKSLSSFHLSMLIFRSTWFITGLTSDYLF